MFWNRVKFIRELDDPFSNQPLYGYRMGWEDSSACLVRCRGEYFVVSTSSAGGQIPPETLAFPAWPSGDIRVALEIAGGAGMTREDVFRELREKALGRITMKAIYGR